MATSFIYSLFVIVPILTVFLDKPFTEPTKKAISLPETTAPKTDIAHSHVLFFFPLTSKREITAAVTAGSLVYTWVQGK